MKEDVVIAQEAHLRPITEIAEALGLRPDELETYGPHKAKISLSVLERLKDRPDGKLVLVTAITPTPAGEGKTTTTVGLGQALAKVGAKGVICIREPSLGPTFGIKGGAAGGGFSQVVPMIDINLHFTGDIHAVTAANNLLAALVDNHLHQGNEPRIHPKRVNWRRCLDMNDRALREVVVGLGNPASGVTRPDGFTISAASEIMAILALARDMGDLKARLARIVVGFGEDGKPVTAGQLKAQGAMAILLKDALKPNLVQTLEHTPAIVHAGPFGNIAHGTSSVLATRIGLKVADYVIQEAGFAADLGAEKFFDIFCEASGLRVHACVVVATARALKMHGGVAKEHLEHEDPQAVRRGIANLERHVDNLKKFRVPIVVAINRFPNDTRKELDVIERYCREAGAAFAVATNFERGGEGAVDLAKKVVAAADGSAGDSRPIYDRHWPIKRKIEAIAREVYRAGSVNYAPEAEEMLRTLEATGYGDLPICMAKTQSSISHDPSLIGAPEGFEFPVRELRLSAGAGFIVAVAGNIMLMPGLPKVPAAARMDIADDGTISGFR
ncbi:MAG TPA: formate--tetrahydrofolate ligase [Candidatus Thermoplasmatota archaeon]